MSTYRLGSAPDWVQLSTLSEIDTTRFAVVVKNQSSSYLSLIKSATKPTDANINLGYLVRTDESTICYASTTPVWIKGSSLAPVEISLHIGNDFDSISSVDLPDDVWIGTSPNRRLQVDPEQASFQDNQQFRLFERFVDVSYTNQIVYFFETVNPVYIIFRKLDLYAGGREYLVYPTTGVTFTGTLGSPIPIRNVNGSLKEGLSSHPVSEVTVRKAIGAGIFNPNSVTAPNGTICVTDGNANRSASTYAPNDQKSGVAAGQSFYLVLNHIGANNNTSGQFSLMWEERF